MWCGSDTNFVYFYKRISEAFVNLAVNKQYVCVSGKDVKINKFSWQYRKGEIYVMGSASEQCNGQFSSTCKQPKERKIGIQYCKRPMQRNWILVSDEISIRVNVWNWEKLISSTREIFVW